MKRQPGIDITVRGQPFATRKPQRFWFAVWALLNLALIIGLPLAYLRMRP